MDFLDAFKLDNDLTAKHEAEIKVVVEADGTVTFSGLSYRDFTSLTVAASLHNYDNPYKPKEREEGAVELFPGHFELEDANDRENQIWHIDQRAILKAIENVTRAALTRHNKSYSKWERRYWRWTSPWRTFMFKTWTVRRAVTQFFAKLKREAE